MGLMNRFSTLFKTKTNTLLDKFEKPEEMLNYSFEKQTELLNKLRRDIAEVVTAKKRLEMQKAKLVANTNTLDGQARQALNSNREDLARLALERKNVILQQAANLDNQINDIQIQQEKLKETERRLSAKVEEFKTRKEVIKAQYSSAEAQVRIKESVTGISEEMSDVGVSLNRAEEKTQKMQAKAQALDEMIDSGVLTDYTTSSENLGGDIEAELDKVTMKSSVDEELEKLKAERMRKKNKGTGQVQQQQEEEEEEAKVTAQ
ncbi:MAG: PspA/IM30 family protein [Thermoproteota archaeon]|nr:PspA/IM30 family protein [Thermoproteota archaeon]MDQ3984742.1 PspA/IM30 family protein [Thermoproteota archaeon]